MSTKTGLAGEFICAAAILGLEGDWTVVHAPQDRFDLLAINSEDNLMLKVQVKTSSILTKGDRNPYYHHQNGHGCKNKKLPSPKEMDIIAHVFFNHRRVAFFATEKMQQFSKRYSVRYPDTPDLEQDTWDRAVQIVQERI